MPPLHELEQIGRPDSAIESWRDVNCDQERALEEVYRIQEEVFPELTLFEIVQRYFSGRGGNKELCVVPYVDPVVQWVIQLEQACKTYHTLPYDGGYLDQPLWLIDVFDHIATIRNIFERKREKEILGKRG